MPVKAHWVFFTPPPLFSPLFLYLVHAMKFRAELMMHTTLTRCIFGCNSNIDYANMTSLSFWLPYVFIFIIVNSNASKNDDTDGSLKVLCLCPRDTAGFE